MFDFSIVTNWIHELLLSIMPEGVAVFIECVAIGVDVYKRQARGRPEVPPHRYHRRWSDSGRNGKCRTRIYGDVYKRQGIARRSDYSSGYHDDNNSVTPIFPQERLVDYSQQRE